MSGALRLQYLPAWLLVAACLVAPRTGAAASAEEIEASVNAALVRLKEQVPGSEAVLEKAKGVLIFPKVIKAGFVIAGEGGEGALRIGGQTKAYYQIAAASIGLQVGAQSRDIILAFLDADALSQFEESEGWKVGADGSVTLVNVGASGQVDTNTLNQPIVAFNVGQKGLMAGVSLDGSKITKVAK